MKEKVFANPLGLNTIAENNARQIKQALQDYLKHAYGEVPLEMLNSDAFIKNLAYDAAVAKSDLRALFRKMPGWIEELQVTIINGTTTHDPDPRRIKELVEEIFKDNNAVFVRNIAYGI